MRNRKPFTNPQKIRAYKFVLEEIKHNKYRTIIHVCTILKEYAKDYLGRGYGYGEYPGDVVKIDFPEFLSTKPRGKSMNAGWWGQHKAGMEKRKKAVRRVIRNLQAAERRRKMKSRRKKA